MQPISSSTSVLQQAKIEIEMDAPVATTQLSQTFVNRTEDIIEAVYNFPVPRQAVIMQVMVTINHEVFTGQIKPVATAEQCYEEGIEEGKRSVLIRDMGDGQHELRAGNLAPEDCIVIHIHIAQLMQAQPGGYRYFLPTVIAPKYGHAGDLADVAHQHSILANYPFAACLKVKGDAVVNCVSHNLKQRDEGYQFDGALDQDIVLTVASQHAQPYIIQSLQDHYPCALSVLPPQRSLETNDTVSVVLLIDCSGSMTGLSMQQTQAGLTSLLTDLQEGSEVSLMCFGNDVMHVNHKPLTINTKNRKVLLKFISRISADMGGTEIWDALSAAQQQGKKHLKTPEIIVLTDGQVWESPAFFDNLSSSKSEPCRLNTIGIGSAVSENIVIKLAEATRGQWILLHPNEPMGERINHFVAQVSAPRTACNWQTENTHWSALPSSTSAVHGGVGYVAYQSDSAPLSISLNDQVLPQSELTGELGLALQKLVGQQQVFALDEAEATKLSLKLGLVNRYTSFVMVHTQSVENADGLPQLAVVPQMISPSIRVNKSINENQIISAPNVVADREQIDYLDLPTFMSCKASHKKTNEQMSFLSNVFFRKSAPEDSFESLVLKKVDKKLTRTLLKGRIPSLKILKAWGLNQDIAEAIEAYFNQHNIDDPLCYLAKTLLWLNAEQNLLSTASIDILQSKIDGATSTDLAAMDAFIQILDDVEVCAF